MVRRGFLSDIEKGLARPTLTTLAALADRLEVALLDVVTFPQEDERQQLVDRSRFAAPDAVRRWLKDVQTPARRRAVRSTKR